MSVRRYAADDGFTLTELIVVTSMLGMVLAIAWAGFSVALNGSELSNQQSMMSREIAAPLELADQVLTQAYEFDTDYPGVTPNRCAAYTDQDDDGNRERYVIEVSGTHLLVTMEEDNGRPRKQVSWSDSNANIAEGVPLFRYFDAHGVEITTMSDVADSVKSIVVTIVTSYDDTLLQDSRTIFLRNR